MKRSSVIEDSRRMNSVVERRRLRFAIATATAALCAATAPFCAAGSPPASPGASPDRPKVMESAPPGVPSNLRVASTTTAEICLSWDDNSANEESFSIERAPEGSNAFAEIGGVKPDVTRFTDSGLSPGAAFQYRVRARNAAGLSAFSNTVVARTVINWLVLIAVNDYKFWRPLQAPLGDARELKELLQKRYQFDESHTIEVLNENATLERIHRLFGELKKSVASQDTVLLFYAGHGKLDSTTNSGFWIPYDGGTDFGQQWLGDVSVLGFIQTLKAKHIFVIADSCFSGNILAAS